MAHLMVKAHPDSHSEYAVYIYHRPENQIEGQSDWEMRSVSRDLKAAMSEAQRLYQSENFQKVEIKQRVLDPRTQVTSDMTLKVLEPGERLERLMLCLLCGLVLCFGLSVVGAIGYAFRAGF